MAIIAVLSKTFQLVGAIVTALGLQYAFLREKYGHRSIITLIKMFFRGGAASSATAPSADASLGGRVQLSSLDTYQVFNLDKSLSPDGQLEQLAEQLRQHRDLIRQLRSEDFGLQKLIEKAGADASSQAADTLSRVSDELEDFRTQLADRQLVDLRLATAGVTISVIGLTLSYWA
jgi:hypothetical protein